MTRRAFFGSVLAGAGAASLAACAPPVPPGVTNGSAVAAPSPTPTFAADRSAAQKSVSFANWTQYVDTDDAGRHGTLLDFQKQSGLTVTYAEDIDDNDVYFNKIAPQLKAGQGIGRDLVVFTDWMVNRCIRQGLAQPLDLSSMTNVRAHLLPELALASFDPGRQYSLPWQSGLTGIAYDASKVKAMKSVEDLWRPDLKGKVVALTEYRDTLGVIMRAQGVDPAKDFTAAQLENAADVVAKQIADGQIRRIRGGSYTQELQNGNALAGIVWSGDIATLREETGNEAWTFVVPESGGMLWSDNAIVPSTATHKANAERLLDYYYQPQVAARVAAYVGYVCPVLGAREAMTKVDPSLADDPLIFPEASFLATHTSVFRGLSAQEESTYAALWATVMGD